MVSGTLAAIITAERTRLRMTRGSQLHTLPAFACLLCGGGLLSTTTAAPVLSPVLGRSVTAADFENTSATICLASPSCPIGASSATINGKTYCHNCHHAINEYDYDYGTYMQCFVANSQDGSRLFLRSATPPCDSLPSDVPALLAFPAAMCKAATCPLRVQSAYIEGSTYCNNCLNAILCNEDSVACGYQRNDLYRGEATCFVEDSQNGRGDFALSSLPYCGEAPPSAPPLPPSAPPLEDSCSALCAASSGCSSCWDRGSLQCNFTNGVCQRCGTWTPEQQVCPPVESAPPVPAPPPVSQPPASPSARSCFAKDSTNACLLSTPTIAPEVAYAQCYRGTEPTDARLVRMADLNAGDLVLSSSISASQIVANQHQAVDTIAEMITLHTEGGSLSLTPDHAIFIDGALAAAADAKEGSILSNGVVNHITKGKGAIINPVTASGTILAVDSGEPVLATTYGSLPIAQVMLGSTVARVLINAGMYVAGDVGSVATGLGTLLLKLAATLTIARAVAQSKSLL